MTKKETIVNLTQKGTFSQKPIYQAQFNPENHLIGASILSTNVIDQNPVVRIDFGSEYNSEILKNNDLQFAIDGTLQEFSWAVVQPGVIEFILDTCFQDENSMILDTAGHLNGFEYLEKLATKREVTKQNQIEQLHEKREQTVEQSYQLANLAPNETNLETINLETSASIIYVKGENNFNKPTMLLTVEEPINSPSRVKEVEVHYIRQQRDDEVRADNSRFTQKLSADEINLTLKKLAIPVYFDAKKSFKAIVSFKMNDGTVIAKEFDFDKVMESKIA